MNVEAFESDVPRGSLLSRALRTPLGDLCRGRVVGDRALSGFLSTQSLPLPVVDLIEGVVRKSRLWPAEEIDVARELVAHFRDGLETGKNIEEVVRDFGDIRKAARLIRRGKLRCRPLVWRLRHRGTQILGSCLVLLLIIYGVLFLRFYGGNNRLDLTAVSDFVARRNTAIASSPVDERAWPLYLEVVADLKAIFDKIPLHPDDDAAEEWRYMDPTSNYWEGFVKLVEADGDVLQRLREATARPRLGLELRLVEDSLDVDLRYVRTIRHLESLLRDHARWALEYGETEVIYQDVLALLSLGEHAAQAGPFFACDLVGWAILTEAVELLEEVLAARPNVLSDEHLVAVSERISTLGEGNRFPMQIEGDQLTMKTFYECLFTDDGHGDGRFTGTRLKALENTVGYWDLKKAHWPFEEWISPALAVLVAGRRETMERAKALYQEIENQLRGPLWQREVPPDYRWLLNVSTDRSLESVRHLPFTAFQLLPLCEDELMVQRRDAAVTVIALERFRRERGAWPEGLNVLTPTFLREVPRDRFDGGALRYRLVDGKPILYSVGVDRNDDGGRPIPDVTGDHNPHNAYQWTSAHLRGASQRRAYDGDWVLWSLTNET